MRNLFYQFIAISFFVLCLTDTLAQNKEISLFDSKGKPTAYIAISEDSTIYSWDGYPQAYLSKNGNDIHIFGFNGKHLGWFQGGIIYNHKGHTVGFMENALMVFTEPEPYKPIKKSGPFRSYQEVIPFKPNITHSFSKQPLSAFLKQGID